MYASAFLSELYDSHQSDNIVLRPAAVVPALFACDRGDNILARSDLNYKSLHDLFMQLYWRMSLMREPVATNGDRADFISSCVVFQLTSLFNL